MGSRHRNRSRLCLRVVPIVLLVLAGGCTSPPQEAPTTPAPGDTPGQGDPPAAKPAELEVVQPTRWVCRPGSPDDPCARGLDAELLPIAGGSREQRFVPAQDPAIDCFYVYPTVSDAPGSNAPRRSTARIEATVRAQAGRFAATCRLYAPVYRQATAASLRSGDYFAPEVLQRVDVDLRSAWHDYLNEDNDGRGVVLIGHSQGSMALQRLLGSEITQHPEQRARIVSALLIGGNVPARTAENGLVPCESPGQLGCVVAYSSFATPPPSTAFFGRSGVGPALCTDPTLLTDGPDGALHPYLPTEQLTGAGGLSGAGQTSSVVRADFIGYPGSLTARCRTADGFSWLDVDAVDRARTPPLDQPLGPQWGLHAADVNLALGDLVEVVRLQGEAWAAAG